MCIIKLQLSGAIDHISKPGGFFLTSYAFISEKHQLLEIIEKGKCLTCVWMEYKYGNYGEIFQQRFQLLVKYLKEGIAFESRKGKCFLNKW